MDIRFSKTKKSQSERSYTDNNYFKMKYCKSCFPGDIISACFAKSSFCWQTLFCFEVFWSFFFSGCEYDKQRQPLLHLCSFTDTFTYHHNTD